MRNWTVRLLHHTHVDIGYTHTQDEVFAIQIRNLQEAMELVDQNRYRADAAQFRWNPEVTLTVRKWLEQASPDEVARFTSMVRDGHIGLDGIYANMLTGLCRPEELAAVFTGKRQLERLTGVPIDSAMITDIPGWNWGMVSALAESGIRYLSSGPNSFDRIGYTITEWGDKPFYWVSPSGRERVLLWVHGKGYAWFHTGLNAKRLRNKLTPARLRRYLRSLERSGYPYDSIIIRYTIGADNGPPDQRLSQIVEDWNATVDDIRLEISTTSKAMAEFEAAHGDRIPEYRGDLTPYWEDGALSTARETALAREASERLTQAQTLAAMTGRGRDLAREARALDDILLFNEHTWGAYNSIRRPDHPFAQSQWAWKRDRALAAQAEVRGLLTDAAGGALEPGRLYPDELSPEAETAPAHQSATVFNTHSWPVSRVVEVSSEHDRVLDADGRPAPSQRLANGRLAFLAEDVPALGSRRYSLVEGVSEPASEGCSVEHLRLRNGTVSVEIDATTGAISSLRHAGVEYVARASRDLFNGYVLVPSKMPALKQREDLDKGVQIEVLDRGPLRCTVRIRRRAARTLLYETEVVLDAHSPQVQISNVLDRPVARRKEGVHFSFPLALPGGVVRYDAAWGTVRLETDQLPGANRDFITASRWVDVSADSSGLCCVLVDAPIFTSGPLRRDPWRMGPPGPCGWVRRAEQDGTIHSYVMNNYWQTNYKADQPGRTLFRYVLAPHGAFSPAENYRTALQSVQPPVVAGDVTVDIGALPIPSHKDIAVSSCVQDADGGLLMRLVNIGASRVETTLDLPEGAIDGARLQIASVGKRSAIVGNRVRLAASETVLVLVGFS